MRIASAHMLYNENSKGEKISKTKLLHWIGYPSLPPGAHICFTDDVNMARKCHNHGPETNPWHHKDGAMNTDTHASERTQLI